MIAAGHMVAGTYHGRSDISIMTAGTYHGVAGTYPGLISMFLPKHLPHNAENYMYMAFDYKSKWPGQVSHLPARI